MRGGLAHPPGFPLQAWINHLGILLHPEQPARTLSLISLLYHFGALLFLQLTLLRLKLSRAVIVLAAFFFAFYPAVFDQAVQPEKYSLILLLQCAAFFYAAELTEKLNGSLSLLPLSVITGLAFSQHYVAAATLPLFLSGLVIYGSKPNAKPRIRSLVITLFIPLTFYCSLPLLRTRSIWPDWGFIQSENQVWRYLFSVTHGFFSSAENIMNFSDSNRITAMEIFQAGNNGYWPILLAFLLLGIRGLFKNNSIYLMMVLPCLFIVICLLQFFSLPSSLHSGRRPVMSLK